MQPSNLFAIAQRRTLSVMLVTRWTYDDLLLSRRNSHQSRQCLGWGRRRPARIATAYVTETQLTRHCATARLGSDAFQEAPSAGIWLPRGGLGRLGVLRSLRYLKPTVQGCHFHKGEILGSKLFQLLPPHHLVRFQRFEEIENEVFQVHYPNPRSKWLNRARFDERLLVSQASIYLWEEKNSNITSHFDLGFRS